MPLYYILYCFIICYIYIYVNKELELEELELQYYYKKIVFEMILGMHPSKPAVEKTLRLSNAM